MINLVMLVQIKVSVALAAEETSAVASVSKISLVRSLAAVVAVDVVIQMLRVKVLTYNIKLL
jgi:hypothetical protein